VSVDQLATVQADFEAYRKRAARDLDQTRLRTRDETAALLVDIVDDCDRALRAIPATDFHIAGGIEQLRDRTIRHFAQLGLICFAEPGEMFDPTRHEAVSVETGPGPDGCIVEVHRRGWERVDDGTLVRTATVTVAKGSDSSEPTYRRRGTPEYICPFGSPGCRGDCLGCTPPPEWSEGAQ
jgi:molecular chaperone GrpE